MMNADQKKPGRAEAAAELIACRARAGVSRAVMAAWLGVDRSTLWRWEQGRADIRRGVLIAARATAEAAAITAADRSRCGSE